MTRPTDHHRDGIAWRELGDGGTVVFLHGLGGTRTAWEPQLAALSDSYRCVAWDMPGYGASAPVEPLTFGAIADRLVDLLGELGVDRADLVGLSFGGMHALHTAMLYPDRVGKLVLTNTSAQFGLDGTTVDGWVSSRLAAIDDGASLADLAPRVLDSLVGAPLQPEVLDQLIESFCRIPEPGFRAAVACLPTHDVLDRLDEIPHETLVIAGELDAETPPAYSQAIAHGISSSTMVTLDGVGHLSPSEQPDMFNQLVRDFLA